MKWIKKVEHVFSQGVREGIFWNEDFLFQPSFYVQKNQWHCEKRQELDVGYDQKLKIHSEKSDYTEFRSFL